MIFIIIFILIIVLVCVLVFNRTGEPDNSVSLRTNKHTSIYDENINIYVCMFQVDNIDLIRLQERFMRKYIKEPFKSIYIMDASRNKNSKSILETVNQFAHGYIVPNIKSDQASQRHAHCLNWCTDNLVKPTSFKENDIIMYIDGDLFFVNDIYPSLIMENTNVRYIKQSNKYIDEYPWPGYLWFKPNHINLTLLDLSLAPRGDTGTAAHKFLSGEPSKQSVSVGNHTSNNTMLEPYLNNALNEHWKLVQNNEMLDIGDEKRFIHIRGLTSNWLKSNVVKERFNIFNKLFI